MYRSIVYHRRPFQYDPINEIFPALQKRHQTDRQVNNRKSRVLRKGQLVEEKWHRVQVGDVIRMENNQFIAADLLVLSSSEPTGLVYIETAELDGYCTTNFIVT